MSGGPRERGLRSLVDDAHAALTAAVDAARVAGRADALVDWRPSDLTRAHADDADHRAVLRAELAHGTIDTLIRGGNA